MEVRVSCRIAIASIDAIDLEPDRIERCGYYRGRRLGLGIFRLVTK